MVLCELVQKLTEGGLFLRSGCSSDDMPGEASKGCGAVRRQFKTRYDSANHCDESVAIEIAERREFMATPTKVGCLAQCQWSAVERLPKTPRRLIAIAGRLVQCALGLAQLPVSLHDDGPGERFEPGSLHVGLPFPFLALLISSTVLLS